jgi:hypothetical protein
MSDRCFIKTGSDPPLCGVHGVALAMTRVPIDVHAPLLGRVNALECPVSEVFVSDETKLTPKESD